MVDSTEFPTKSVSFKITLKAASYYLSLYDENVVATVSKFILGALNLSYYLPRLNSWENTMRFFLIYSKTVGVFAWTWIFNFNALHGVSLIFYSIVKRFICIILR